MGIYKVIDIVGTSEKSFSDAVKNAVDEAAKTVKKIKRNLRVIENSIFGFL